MSGVPASAQDYPASIDAAGSIDEVAKQLEGGQAKLVPIKTHRAFFQGGQTVRINPVYVAYLMPLED